jgi:hypothetical protein
VALYDVCNGNQFHFVAGSSFIMSAAFNTDGLFASEFGTVVVEACFADTVMMVAALAF